MAEQLKVLNSNVRGLNDGAKRAAVRAFIERMASSIVCLQETKLSSLSDALRLEIAGPRYDGHASLNANGTRGGVLLLWQCDAFTAMSLDVRSWSITVCLLPVDGSHPWTITTVYGPHDEPRKQSFLAQLVDMHNSIVGPWMILGDFNLNLDRRWMARFRGSPKHIQLA
jgi:exonuclease III